MSLAGAGGLQVEEISPQWLRRGSNTVEFLPASAKSTPSYRVSKVRVVGLPHTLSMPAERAMVGAGEAARNTDGAFATDFGQRMEVHDLSAGITKAGSGTFDLFSEKRKRISSVDLAGLAPGWHRFSLGASSPTAERVSLRPRDRGKEAGRVGNVVLTASAQPHDGAGRLAVTYPLHAECADGRALVRGFVEGYGGQPIDLRIEGRSAPEAVAADGSFAFQVPEPESARGGPFASSDRGRTSLWPAAAAEGAARSLLARGSRGRSRAEPRTRSGAPYGELVSPSENKTIGFAGATLEIPKGALERPTRITIRPLAGDELQPMGRAMRNVTPGMRAFRFGPRGLKFKKPVKLTLPIDRAKLPPGLGEQDVYGFYFDESVGKWVKIGRYGVDASGAVLASVTDHFTDFVNATLAMPDQPGAKSFNPNEIQGIELGSPSAGIPLIEPPEAGSNGSARLSHAIEVPPGRNGLQPALAIGYDSEGQNGWLGVGWDLAVSSIEIDTRFGVPRYENSEQYLLDGDRLTPSAPGSNRFARRVEGSFDKIERTGSLPDQFHWVVTDKSGTKYVYGQSPSARLADPGDATHVFRWMLERVEDSFGNQMLFSYFTDSGNNGEPFVQIYPERIDYTSHPGKSLAASYHVDFVRGTETRPDVQISARAGFQVMTRFLLSHVDVRLGAADVIRRYALAYQTGPFQKKLLGSIALHGNGTPAGPGRELARHGFRILPAPDR